MSWKRVAFAVLVAAGATLLGLTQPGLRPVLLFPALLVSRFIGGSDEAFGGPWFVVWIAIYAQLFFWALVAELVRIFWSKLSP